MKNSKLAYLLILFLAIGAQSCNHDEDAPAAAGSGTASGSSGSGGDDGGDDNEQICGVVEGEDGDIDVAFTADKGTMEDLDSGDSRLLIENIDGDIVEVGDVGLCQFDGVLIKE